MHAPSARLEVEWDWVQLCQVAIAALLHIPLEHVASCGVADDVRQAPKAERAP